MNTNALFMMIFIDCIAIVGGLYFYIQDKKEERAKREQKHAE